MDRRAYGRRAADTALPTTAERLASLEAWRKAFKEALEAWVVEHNRIEKRKWETHRADHDALTDHVYALDEKLRRIE